MSAKTAKAYPKEDAEQRTVIQWARLVRVPDLDPPLKLAAFLIHLPNGGKRRPVEAAIFKALGVRSGVSDLLLALPLHAYAGLWIEMKRRRAYYGGAAAQASAVSAPQREWLALMAQAGYATAVAYGADEAIEIITRYIGGEFEHPG